MMFTVWFGQVFGDMSVAGVNKEVKTALIEGTQNLEGLGTGDLEEVSYIYVDVIA